jgi:hypothetical protein
VDINPLSVFVTKVKTKNYSKDFIPAVLEALDNIISSRDSAAIQKPDSKIFEKAFHPEILEYLLKLKYRINRIINPDVRDFILLAYLSIIEKVSNTYKEGNGIKYRFTKRTKNGYVQIPIEEWQQLKLPSDKIGFVNGELTKQIGIMLRDVEDYVGANPDIQVICGDARKLSEYIEPESISLCAFSPPYCNCFDYYEIYKLELWLGEFIKSKDEMRYQRKKAFTSNTNTEISDDFMAIPVVEELVNEIDVTSLWNKKVTRVIRGYFNDTAKTLSEIYKVLQKNGRCAIIIGNSAYGGVLIPTDLIISEIAKNEGFKVDKIIVARHLTTSSQQKKKLSNLKKYLRESIVCLSK